MGKGVSRQEFYGLGRRSHSPRRAYVPAKDDRRQSQLGDYNGGGSGKVANGSGTVNLPPWAVRKLAEILIPVVKQIATAAFPPLGPLLGLSYGLYLIYQNREKIAEIAEKISDDDIDGLAIIAAKEIAKKGVEVVAESAAKELAEKSAERLRNAGLFDQLPDAEAYYKDYMADEVSKLIEENGEKFIDKL
jgi:hypothetical protein